jgi:hypothetical protein
MACAAICFLLLPTIAQAQCAICDGPIIGGRIYVRTDRVTNEEKELCQSCSKITDQCFICALPVKKNFLDLDDGRFLCARDKKTVVLDEQEAKSICAQVWTDLDNLFSRFTSFPTNLEVTIVDQVNLRGVFKLPGNVFECPNIKGYMQARTNEGRVEYKIHVMTALAPSDLRSTCAHEYSHAWVYANVPPDRLNSLSADAHEGFCELISYMFMDSRHDEKEKNAILDNQYTRGHIDLFIEAQRKYGIGDIMDWMKFGVDDKLDKEDLVKLRDIKVPGPVLVSSNGVAASTNTIASSSNAAPLTNIISSVNSPTNETAIALVKETVSTNDSPRPLQPQPSAGPDRLMLKGISLAGKPLAMINNQTFLAGESAKVAVAGTNVLIKCIAIRERSVRIQIVSSGEEQELFLKTASAKK